MTGSTPERTPTSPLRVLVVGAGAIGQVYGYYLARGGARVTYLVKAEYAEGVSNGFRLYQLRRGRVPRATLFDDFEILRSDERPQPSSFDAVLLCVSSTALHSGPWLSELATALGGGTMVVLQAGAADFSFAAEACPGFQMVQGMVPFTSYQAPLPSDLMDEEGVAYWFPPFMKVPFTGRRNTIAPLIRTLEEGGMPARAHPNARTAVAFGEALLQPQVLVLECAGWSIDKMQNDKELMSLAHLGMREASAIAAHLRNARVPLGNRLLGPRGLKLAMRLFRRLAPMDLDAFFEFHYAKVHDQSMAGLAEWIRVGDEQGIRVDALEEIQHRLTG